MLSPIASQRPSVEQQEPGVPSSHSLANVIIHRPDEDADGTVSEQERSPVEQGNLLNNGPVQLQQKGETTEKTGQAFEDTREAGQDQENRTGLPDSLKAGLERLSGYSLSDIRVHYDSPKPDALQALAYTRGTEIHVGPGQEQHLAHEAWHVVQQKQGRVKPTGSLDGIPLNEDPQLESEADTTARQIAGPFSTQGDSRRTMGQQTASPQVSGVVAGAAPSAVVQRVRNGLSVVTTSLNSTEEADQKAVFTAGKGQQSTPVTINGTYARSLFSKLKKVAEQYLGEMKIERTSAAKPTNPKGKSNKKANTATISPNDYDALVALAIEQVKTMYHVQLQEAHQEAVTGAAPPSSVFDASENGGTPISRAEPDVRWNRIKADPAGNAGRIQDEAVAAARYILDTEDQFHEDAQNQFETILTYHQQQNPTITAADVEEAYLNALTQDTKYQAYVNALAEVRLKWDPKTEGSTVYLAQVSEDYLNNLTEDERAGVAWDKLKRVVHEIVHTVAHQKFEDYAHQHEEYSNTIVEGTVDYFALKVWGEINNKLQGGSPPQTLVQPVQNISGTDQQHLLSANAMQALQQMTTQPLYEEEVKTIKAAISKIPSGEERLKAAFFYGDVDHFFPKF